METDENSEESLENRVKELSDGKLKVGASLSEMQPKQEELDGDEEGL